MKLKTPVIIVNFKAYEESIGANSLKLAKICEKVAKKYKVSIAVAVQAADIYRVAKAVKIPVFSQHIDDDDYGGHTGSVLAEDVKSNGAIGTLLNHSEKRLRLDTLENCINQAKKNKLITVVCAPDAETGKALFVFKPDFIAVEPPELIGGKVSVSSAKPEVITKSVKMVCGINMKKCPNLIVGAGVHNSDDVKIALKLGANGVLVASGVVKAKDPEKALLELVKGLKK